MFRNVAIAFVLLVVSFSLCPAQGFAPMDGHSVTNLGSYQGYYLHWRSSYLANLRQQVNMAVYNNFPPQALGPLNEIIRIEPHDFIAWEFLSYTYSVLQNAPSAANVDLDLVTYFEFIPAAAPQVSRAMNRLQIWDPYGWQGRVNAKRAALVPYIPFEVVDHFVESVRPEISRNNRRRAHFAVERIMTTRKEFTEFIEIWESGKLSKTVAKHTLEKSQICESAYLAIQEY